MARTKYKLVDLFSGAGGFTLGFREAGFEPIFAVEREPDFARTYAENFGHHVVGAPIEDLLSAQSPVPAADVIIGGPPCQGFSNLAGNRASDPRRSLWRHFLEFILRADAKVFVCENVPNMISSKEGQEFIRRARRAGFEIAPDGVGVLLASDFGVPQNRRRGFILGSRLGELTLPEPGLRRVSVREAFKRGLYPGDRSIPLKPTHYDLYTQPATGPDLHIARNPTELSRKRYRLIPPGGNRFDLQRKAPELTPGCWIRKTSGGTDLFGRLAYDEPARCTIRTEFYKPEKGRYLHPVEHRPITHWEAARLQSFPDSFRWHGSKVRIAIQIGNAVPPLLANAVANQVHAHLKRHGCRPVRRPRPGELSTVRSAPA